MKSNFKALSISETITFQKLLMLRSWIKSAWRNIVRNKAFTAINVVGLGLGMACCLLIFLWVKDERSVNNFFEKNEQLYTAYETVDGNGQIRGSYSTPLKFDTTVKRTVFLMEDLRQSVPEVLYEAMYSTGYELP